jgi:hypothetical protein
MLVPRCLVPNQNSFPAVVDEFWLQSHPDTPIQPLSVAAATGSDSTADGRSCEQSALFVESDPIYAEFAEVLKMTPGTQMNQSTTAIGRARRAAMIGLALAVSISSAFAADAKPIAVGKSLSDANIRIEVEELERTADGNVMLKFALVNGSGRDLDSGFLGSPTLGEVHLVDLVNRRQYDVGGNVTYSLSSTFRGAKSQSRTELWALYGAPPQGVGKVSIIAPNFYPIDDVRLGN